MTLKTTKLRDAITFVLAAGATTIVGTGAAFAQDTATTELDRIEVTGSRIKRTDIETSQPIFSMSREEIQAQGLTSVGDVIQNISTNGSTLNTTYNNGGNGETRVNLRNIGSNRTLVLVNGRRWVGGTGLGGAVDLNTIPTAAVERIEVLKDGASTIYGSDAIAGVVNVILRQNFDGAEANAYFGQFDKGDGTRQAYDITIGSSGERWSAMAGAGYVKEEPVWAGDREISAVPNFGSSPGYGGSAALPDGLMCIFDDDLGCTNPDRTEYGVFIPDPSNPNGWRPYRGIVDNYNFAPDNYLITPQERKSIFANASLDISDNLRFKMTTTFNQRRSEQILAAMPVSFGVFASGVGSSVVISANNIYNDYGQEIAGGLRRTVETGGRIFRQNVDTFAFNGGFEGTFEVGERYFDWEAGMFYGENSQSDSTDGLLTFTALRNALGASFIDGSGTPRCGTPGAVIEGCVPLDFLHGPGTITPEMLSYVTFQAHDQFGYEQKNYYANIGGDLFNLPGGPLAFSFGIESRTESGYDHPDALINAGDTTGNARTATDGSFKVDEAYLEFAVPVLADVPGAQLLDFSIASRYSDYSNFGDTINSKFGFRWKPIDDLMIRGNWSEGFRAPSVTELFSGAADSYPTISDPCAGSYAGEPNTNRPGSCAGIPAYNQTNPQIRITVGGNINLQPETSVSKTLGFVYSPSWLEGFDVSLDWWQIELTDTITGLGGQTILNRCYFDGDSNACALIERNPNGSIADLLSAGLNIGSTIIEGYDMTVGYRMPETAWGKFSIIWDSTYFTRYENDDDGDNLVGEYFDRDNHWRIRSNLNLRWELGDWGASWFTRFYSKQDESCLGLPSSQWSFLCSSPTRRDEDGPAPENRIGSTTYHDANLFWKSPWNATVTLGVNNILDKDPPRAADTFANSFDPQYEIPGRFYYLRYTKRF